MYTRLENKQCDVLKEKRRTLKEHSTILENRLIYELPKS